MPVLVSVVGGISSSVQEASIEWYRFGAVLAVKPDFGCLPGFGSVDVCSCWVAVS